MSCTFCKPRPRGSVQGEANQFSRSRTARAPGERPLPPPQRFKCVVELVVGLPLPCRRVCTAPRCGSLPDRAGATGRSLGPSWSVKPRCGPCQGRAGAVTSLPHTDPSERVVSRPAERASGSNTDPSERVVSRPPKCVSGFPRPSEVQRIRGPLCRDGWWKERGKRQEGRPEGTDGRRGGHAADACPLHASRQARVRRAFCTRRSVPRRRVAREPRNTLQPLLKLLWRLTLVRASLGSTSPGCPMASSLPRP